MKIAVVGASKRTLILLTALAAAKSFEDMREDLDAALESAFGRDNEGYRRFFVVATFPDYIIARGCSDDDLFQIPYSINDQSVVKFGDPKPVDIAYIPSQSTGEFATAEAAGATSEDEWIFPVVVMKAGFANGTVEYSGKKVRQYFGADVLAQVALAVNGARFGRKHPAAGENENSMPERIAGWVDNGRVIGSGDQASVVADVHLLKSETQLQATLLAARNDGKLDLFGVSVLGYFGYTPDVIGGEPVLRATKLAKLSSIDWCAEPAAGGRFLDNLRTAAARDPEIALLQRNAVKPAAKSGTDDGGAEGAGRRGMQMKQAILTLLAALKKKNAVRATELETEFTALSEDKHNDFLTKLSAEVTADPAAAGDPLKEAQTALAAAKKIQAESMVQTKLAESKLTGQPLEYLKTTFANRIAENGEITEAFVTGEIERARTAFAAFSAVGRMVPGGIRTGLESIEKIKLALDGMLGVKDAAGKGVAPFRGIREAYVTVTGDAAVTFSDGGFQRTSMAAIAAADFPNLLLDSMNKRLLQDYAEVGMGGLDQLLTVGSPIGDYKTQQRVREGYLVDLSSVAENGPYTEIAHNTDERVSFAVGKFGNTLSVSEETIKNDDLGAIARFPSRLARAARRTLKQYVTNFFINNPNYGVDAVAWFHANHSNLGAVALSIDELVAREVALMLQQEKDSNKPLGLQLNWIMVPAQLKASAYKINQAQFYNPGPAIQEPNPFYQRFGANNERIIVNELLADANDWYYGTSPSDAPFLEIGYLDGYQQPQILLANLPTQGVSFTNDQIQYKVKFVFGGVPVDYRGVGKNVVA